MATFRCLQSGNTVTFTQQHDIDSMRGHDGYVRINDEPSDDVKVSENRALPMMPPVTIRRVGRPRKATV
jgi:hypothetical protein